MIITMVTLVHRAYLEKVLKVNKALLDIKELKVLLELLVPTVVVVVVDH